VSREGLERTWCRLPFLPLRLSLSSVLPNSPLLQFLFFSWCIRPFYVCELLLASRLFHIFFAPLLPLSSWILFLDFASSDSGPYAWVLRLSKPGLFWLFLLISPFSTKFYAYPPNRCLVPSSLQKTSAFRRVFFFLNPFPSIRSKERCTFFFAGKDDRPLWPVSRFSFYTE